MINRNSNKITLNAMLCTILILSTACSKDKNISTLKTDSFVNTNAVGLRPEVQTINKVDVKIDSEDMNRLIDINYNSLLSMPARKVLNAMIIEDIAKKQNVSPENIKQELLKAVGADADSISNGVSKFQSAIKASTTNIKNYFGFNTDAYKDTSLFLENDTTVRLANVNDLLANNKIKLARLQFNDITLKLFKSLEIKLDEQAELILKGLLSNLSEESKKQLNLIKQEIQIEKIDLAQKNENNSDNKLMSKLDEINLKAADFLTQVAAVQKTEFVTEPAKKAAIIYQSSKTLVKLLSFDQENKVIGMQVINKDLQSAAGKISLVLEAMAEFQGKYQDTISNMSSSLKEFKDKGTFNISTNTFSISADKLAELKLPEKIRKCLDKASEISKGVKVLNTIAVNFGVDPKITTEIDKGINLVNSGISIVNSLAGPNPMQGIMSAASLLMGDGQNIDPAEQRHQEVMGKLNEIVKTQAVIITKLDNIQETLGKMQELQVTQLKATLDLSKQVTFLGQFISVEFGKIQTDIQFLKESIIGLAQTPYHSCQNLPELNWDLNEQISYKSKLFSKNIYIAKSLIKLSSEAEMSANNCVTAYSQIPIDSIPVTFRNLDQNGVGQLFKMIRLFSMKSLNTVSFDAKKLPASLVNPVLDVASFVGLNEARVETNSNAKLNFWQLSDSSYLDTEKVIQTVSTFLNSSASITLSGIKDADSIGLESYYKISDANITDNLNHLYRLLGWIQTAIEQESFLSGATLLNSIRPSQLNNVVDCRLPENIEKIECLISDTNDNDNRNSYETDLAMNFVLYNDLTDDAETKPLKDFYSRPKEQSMQALSSFNSVLNQFSGLNQNDLLQTSEYIFNGSSNLRNWQYKTNISSDNTLENVFVKIGQKWISVPKYEDLKKQRITYSKNMKYLLSLRNQMVDYIAQAEINAYGDKDVRLFQFVESLKY